MDHQEKINCAYCTKEVNANQSVKRLIYGRGRKMVWDRRKMRNVDKAVLTQTEMLFCAATCESNCQMSKEG